MGNKLYIGNLSFNATEDSLRDTFAAHGTVDSCRIITDRDTGRSKGFGFIEMSSSEEAQTCVDQLNGTELDGRAMNVNEARPQENRRNHRGGNSRW